MRRFIALALLGFAACAAHADTLKVLTAGAYKPVLLALQPGFEARTGHRLVLENDTAGALARRVAAGDAFDVVIMPPAQFSQAGANVQPGSVVPLARVGVGMAVRAGAPASRVANVDDFKALVLAARKVAYIDPASGGSSGIYLQGLFDKLGIAAAVAPKAVLVRGGLSAERVASGEADLAIQQVSELMVVPGVTVIGLLPEDIQNYTTYNGAIASRSAYGAAAQALLAALQSPDAAPVLRDKGMLPGR